MWVDINGVRAELELLYRKTEEMLAFDVFQRNQRL